MSLSNDQINAAAHTLFEAEKTRTQIGILTQQFPAMDMEDAYAVQKQLVKKNLTQAGQSRDGKSA